MKRIGWTAMLLCMALVITGCPKSEDRNVDSAGDVGEADDMGTGTEAVGKSMAGKGGKKVAKAVGAALWNSVKGDANTDKDRQEAPEF